jgi:endo-1,4-beta-xylanase
MRLSHTRSIIFWIVLGIAGLLGSCKHNVVTPTPPAPPVTPPATPAYTDTVGPLKTAAAANGGMLFGIASDYPTVTTTPVNLGIIAREAAITTFGYEMKHGAIVQNNGTFNYAGTDAQFNAVTNVGLQVHGHTLLWYANQNATYLNSIVAGTVVGSAPNLLTNGGFETWSGGIPSGWSVYNQTNGSFAQGSGTANVQSGSSSLMVTVTAAGQAYNTQLVSNAFTTVSGHNYTVIFYVMAAASGGLWQLEAPYGVNYTGTKAAPTTWTPEIYSFTAGSASAMIAFDMGTNPGTYYIDNVTVVDATAAGPVAPSAAAAAAVDSVLKLWISGSNGIVTRYAGKIKAWDVVNEPMSDGNSGLRTSSNTSIPSPRPGDWFFWADYLGRAAALHAFQYAKTADPNALLFINDYNLETNTAKLDSLIAYVRELQGEGAKIDGIGTEMHIAYNTPRPGIDAAFQALAATGLKVRISELDVAINPGRLTSFTSPPDPTLLTSQADMYHYVISSYIKNVPAAQRFGITVWGVDDPQSWLNTPTAMDFPLLFDGSYNKKIAYAGVLQALKGK